MYNGYITVWKSILDNLEHQPKFNLQHNCKGVGWWFGDFCIDNGYYIFLRIWSCEILEY